MQFRAHFFPRNRLHFAGIDLADSSLHLGGPCGFNIGIRFAMETLE